MADTDEAASPEHPIDHALEPEKPPTSPKTQRPITLYDAVTGRAGQNGFLSEAQNTSGTVLPATPEQILLDRKTIPKNLILDNYNRVNDFAPSKRLPESELLKAIHTYASDFYAATSAEQGIFDFKSLDETALIAMGILIEEAVKEALGENGDMVFVEPGGLEFGLEETPLSRYQIKGRVRPRKVIVEDEDGDDDEDSLGEEESPAKKQRR